MHQTPRLGAVVAANLTPREREVLLLVADGSDQKEVAARLSISPKTVGSHLERIFTKLGVRSLAQAVALVYREDRSKRGPPLRSLFVPLALPGEDFCEWVTAFANVYPLA